MVLNGELLGPSVQAVLLCLSLRGPWIPEPGMSTNSDPEKMPAALAVP